MTLLHQAAQKAVEALTDARNAYEAWGVGTTKLDRAIAALQQQPEPPPECKTEDEKRAFAFGWWKALEAQRGQQQPEPADSLLASHLAYTHAHLPALQHQEVPREPEARNPLPAETAQPMFASHVGRRKWEQLQGDGYRMQRIHFARSVDGHERRGTIDPWGKVLWEAETAASPSTTRQQEVGSEPALLFDGYYVYSEGLTDRAKQRTSPENVADVLDAVVRLMRAAPSTPENAGGGKEAREPELWAVHVQGFDDVHAAPSKAEAEAAAQRFNEWAANRPDQHELDPIMHAVAVPWAYSPGAHKCALPHWPEFAGKAGAEGRCECGLSEAACRDPLRRSCPDGGPSPVSQTPPPLGTDRGTPQ